MSYERKEIAIYGKGGIGKSTVCANLSVALAQAGLRVLQIGCDPKHDSTRLLTGGRSLPTVLDYLRDAPADRTRAEDILGTGTLGIGCIEAGGPKPGVGCAGRGIISAFEFLERDRVKERYDAVLYDVLGDVVCGGFAVPIRREYAKAIFLVTSGEFMAIYAANNILRGIRNFDGSEGRRVAGSCSTPGVFPARRSGWHVSRRRRDCPSARGYRRARLSPRPRREAAPSWRWTNTRPSGGSSRNWPGGSQGSCRCTRPGP